jgi:putative serine protease PepD
MLFAALVGAVVAALVTGVLFVAFGRDTKSSSSSDTTPLALTGSDNQGAASRGTAGGVDVRAVLARIQPAVVRIKITTADGAAAGTGIVIDPGGTIVTNAHVVSGASTIQVQLPNGDLLPATAKGVDATHDLAVINVHAHDLASATLGNSDVLQVGDPVIAVGNALDLGISVTSGIVSAIDRDVPEENGNTLLGALQTDAAINPGNSGGPLVNASGQVIGINTAIASPEESNNVGFAIAISAAKPIIADLAAGRPARDALLGVDSDPVTPDLVAQHHLRVSAGAYVTEVGSTTAAAKVGIVRGDVIVSLDGKPVTTTDELRRYVRRHRPGDKVRVVYVRADGSRHSVSVTLGSGE